jgi:hypothetical protein
MKKLSLSLAAVALLCASSVSFAAPLVEYVTPDAGFVSAKTRAQVTVDLAGRAAASDYAAPDAGFVATKTRAQVQAELAEAYAKGEMHRNGELDSIR